MASSSAILIAELADCRERRRAAVEGIRAACGMIEAFRAAGDDAKHGDEELLAIDKILKTTIFHAGEKP